MATASPACSYLCLSAFICGQYRALIFVFAIISTLVSRTLDARPAAPDALAMIPRCAL